jgi:hypothetical protein
MSPGSAGDRRDGTADSGEPGESDESGESDEETAGISRRALLAGGVLATGGLAAGGYHLYDGSASEGAQTPTPTPSTSPPDPTDDVAARFDVWAELEAALRDSPDHLPGTASELVEAGDPEAIFEFVSDEIVPVPTGPEMFGDVVTVRRWGPRGTLRAGMGTPRDTADLLATLLTEAGFDASVKTVRVEFDDVGLTEADLKDDLLAPIEREFDPDLTENDFERWGETFEIAEFDDKLEIVDPEGTERQVLAETLREALPEQPSDRYRGPETFQWLWDNAASDGDVPIVAFETDEGTRYANPFGDVPFGETGSERDVREAPDPTESSVRVTLSARSLGDLEAPIELASGEWDLTDLLGRQLKVRTPPTTNPIDKPDVQLKDLNSFIPSLSVQGVDMSPEEQGDLAVFGDIFKMDGSRLSVEHQIEDGEVVVDDPTIRRNGEPLYDPENPGDPASVETLEVSASGVDAPRIRLDARALDDNDDPVGGLPASAFLAVDESEPHDLGVTASQGRATVVLLRDISGSMGAAVEGAYEDALYEDLVEAIYDVRPETDVVVRKVDSAMWSHLTEAALEQPDLIVVAHDGGTMSSYREVQEKALQQAPPVVLLSAGEEEGPVEEEVITNMAEITGGETAALGDREATFEAVETAVEALDVPTYRLDYHVSPDVEGSRTVELQFGDDPRDEPRLSATDTYTTDGSATAAHGTGGNPLVGLYLTTEIGSRTVRRTLAGWDPDLSPSWDPSEDPPDEETGFGMPGVAEYVGDVRNALLGGVDISFEGDGIPFSVAMADVLAAQQTAQQLVEAIATDDMAEIKPAWNAGFMDIPWSPLLLQGHLPEIASEEGVTFFTEPRVVAYQVKPTFEDNEIGVRESVDIMPFARSTTAGLDADTQYWRTLERTAWLAVAESTAFEVTTQDMLAGKDLVRREDMAASIDNRDQIDTYNELVYRESIGRGATQLVPVDGSADALWNVTANGSLLGLLRDGTGGGVRFSTYQAPGEEDLKRTASLFSLLTNIYKKANLISAGGSMALGAVAEYYVQLSLVYVQVTAYVGSISTGNIPEDAPGQEDLNEMLTNTTGTAATSAGFSMAPGVGGTYSRYKTANNIATLAGGMPSNTSGDG